MKQTAIICVLKLGGDFIMKDVEILHEMLLKHTTIPFDFVCLTDDDMSKPFRTISLRNKYKGWWSKIELFRSELVLNERILYFDLDTVITQNIDNLLEQDEKFIGLLPFNKKKVKIKDFVASGIMGWINDGSFSFVYDEFNYAQARFIYKGDQDYISDKLKENLIPITYWQDIVEGVFSYKRHIRNKKVKKEDARIICFHGKPRPKKVVL